MPASPAPAAVPGTTERPQPSRRELHRRHRRPARVDRARADRAGRAPHRRPLHPRQPRQGVEAARQHRALPGHRLRPAAASPTWPCAGWRPTPTRSFCRPRACSTGSATSSSPASTGTRPACRPSGPPSASAAFVVTLAVVRRARDLERYRYTFAFVGIGLLLLPLARSSARTSTGPASGSTSVRSTSSRASSPRSPWPSSSPPYLVERADLLRQGTRRVGRFLVLDPALPGAHPRRLGPLAPDLPVRERPGIVVPLLRPVHRHAVGVDGAGATTWRWAPSCSPPARPSPSRSSATPETGCRSGSTRGPYLNTGGYQIVQGWFAIAAGGHLRRRPGTGQPQRIPEAATDFIFAAIAEELGLLGAAALVARVPPHRRHGPAHRHPLRTPVREAAGHRAVAHPRGPDLRDHRRRDPAHSPDRDHPAVRVLRRVLADRQLHPAGAAAAHLQRHR